MDGRTRGMQWAGLALALGCAQLAFAGTPVQGSFRVSARVPAPPAVAFALLDSVPSPAHAQRLARTGAGDSFRVERDADSVSRDYRQVLSARGYRLVWQSQDGRVSTWDHATHRVEVEVRDVLGSTPTARVVVQAIVQATPAS